MKQLRQEGRIAIEAVLTEEQKQKFSAMREKRKEKRTEGEKQRQAR